MKALCYINSEDIWFDDRSFKWKKDNLDDVLKAVHKDLGINGIKVVLGSEVSYMATAKLEEPEITREAAFEIARANLPFELTESSFDWKRISLGEDDDWIQVMAVEPEFLRLLSDAAEKAGIKIDWAIPVGSILATASLKYETPVLIRWQGKEKISVLAIRGLVDFVGNESDDEINSFAKHKWHLAVNPEHIVLSDREFDFEVTAERMNLKGKDEEVLGVMVKEQKVISLGDFVSERIEGGLTIEMGPQRKRRTRLALVALLLLSTVGGVYGLYRYGQGLQESETQQEITTPTAVPIEISSPSATPVDFSVYKIQVLNGSGISGAAADLREDLLSAGFVSVDIGNAGELQARTNLAYKQSLPGEVISTVTEVLSRYDIGDVNAITDDKLYDLIVIIGSTVTR